MVNQKTGQADWKMVGIVDILGALSDDKAFTIYNTIFLSDRQDFKASIKHMGITPHQYHSRLLRLTKAGLIRRENPQIGVNLVLASFNLSAVCPPVEDFKAG